MTFGRQNALDEACAQLDCALDRGVNFIGAAEMYPVPARAEIYGRTEFGQSYFSSFKCGF